MYPIKPSFAAGEISPKLHGRVDLNQYQTGLKTLENFIVTKQGSVENRPGTEFLYDFGELTGVDRPLRMIPFEYSTEQAYLLILADYKIYVLKNDALIMDGASPLEIVTPWQQSQIYEIDYAQSADVIFFVHQYYAPRKLSRTSDTSWTLDLVTFVDGPYADRAQGDSNVILTPSGKSGLVSVTSSSPIFAADMLGQPIRFGYPDYEDPTDIDWGWGTIDQYTNASNIAVTIVDPLGYELMLNGDFDSSSNGWLDNSTGTSNELIYNSGNKSITIQTVADGYGSVSQQIDYFPPKTALKLSIKADISLTGRMRVQAGDEINGSNWLKKTVYDGEEDANGEFHFYFTTPKSERELYITIDNRYEDPAETIEIYNVSLSRADLATNEWRTPAWDAGYGRGYGFPQHIIFHEQRLCFSTTFAYPQTVWMSKTGNFYDFGFSNPGVDDDAINFTLSSYKIDAIQWMLSSTDLILGTYSSIWKLSPGGQTDSITPTSISARIQTTNGGSNFKPLQSGATILYIQRGDTVIRDFAYSFESDSFQGRDLTVASDHLFKNRKIWSWDYAALDDSIVWVVMDDGQLIGMTYINEQDMVAWHQHVSLDNFIDVCILNTPDTDKVYLLSNRYHADSAEYHFHLEKMSTRKMPVNVSIQHTQFESFYQTHFSLLENSVLYYGNATDTITGLSHLNGQSCYIVADGDLIGPQIISGGQIVFNNTYNVIHVGVKIVNVLETLDIDFNDNEGATIGRKKKISRVIIRLLESRTGSVGTQRNDALPIKFNFQEDGLAPGFDKDGIFEISPSAGWNNTGKIYIFNEIPMPITILSITPEVEIASR